MKIDITIGWKKAPTKGRIEVIQGKLVTAGGWEATVEQTKEGVCLLSNKPCSVFCVISAERLKSGKIPTIIRVKDTRQPFTFALEDVLEKGSLPLAQVGVVVTGGVKKESSSPMTAFKGFTKEQIKGLGPRRQCDVIPDTERHVYVVPFWYQNVEVNDWYEWGVNGMEMKANTGSIIIRERKPIVAVTVIGSACTPKGYNICEWWDEGEDIDKANIKNQLVKRQRIDNLNGTHPSIYSLSLMGMYGTNNGWKWFSRGEFADLAEGLRRLTDNYYGHWDMGFYENVASFHVGPPYPKQVTIRCGTKIPEDVGYSLERYPGDYCVRVVETIVIK